jgi:hypothetical protein
VDPLVNVLLPLVLAATGVFIGLREWQQYKASAEVGHDLFVYSRGRLARRLSGVATLLALAATLFAFGAFPANNPRGASVYLALMIGEVAVLLILPVLDLWETARTARPEELDRQADRPRRD